MATTIASSSTPSTQNSFIYPNDSLLHAAKVMKTNKLSALAVVHSQEDKRLLGIITDCDIVRKSIVLIDNACTNAEKSITKTFTGSNINNNETNVAATVNGSKLPNLFETALVKDYMTYFPKVVTVADATSKIDLEKCLAVMVINNFRHVPVVRESNGEYVKMVDIIDAASDFFEKSTSAFVNKVNIAARKILKFQWLTLSAKSKRGKDEENEKESNGEFGNHSAITLPTSSTVLQAAKLLASEKRSALIVVSPYGVTGIITESDIVRRVIANDLNPGNVIASEIMTPNPHCLTNGVDTKQALQEMVKSKFRHIPVQAKDGNGFSMIIDIISIVRLSMRRRNVELVDKSTQFKFESERALLIKQVEVKEAQVEDDITLDSSQEVIELSPSKKMKQDTDDTAIVEHEIQAMKFIQASEFEKAVTEFEKALNAINETGDASGEVAIRILSRKAAANSALGNVESALVDYEKAYKLATKKPSHQDVIDEVCTGLAETYLELERYERVREIVGNIQDQQKVNSVYELMFEESMRIKDDGREFFVKEESMEAMTCFTNALRIHSVLNGTSFANQRSDFPRLGAILFCNRAATYLKANDVLLALEDCFFALKLDPTYDRIKERLASCKAILDGNKEHNEIVKRAMKSSGFDEKIKATYLDILIESGIMENEGNNESNKENSSTNSTSNETAATSNTDAKNEIRNLGLLFLSADNTV